MWGAGGGAVLLTLALFWLRPGTSAGLDWAGEQQVPAARTDYSDDSSQHSLAAQFSGNSSHTDHFKLLKEDGTSVLVGARNIIYNLSLPNLIEYTDQRIYWSCSASDKAACDLKGKGPEDCQNYIRVLSVISPSRLLVCGTNCYNPLCRHYQLDPAGYYSKVKEFSGKGYAPYDPTHNSTSLFTSGNLFAATVADFSATDSLIIKNNLRTEQYDYKHLNAPDFVSSLEDEEHVYFFFREAAVEFMNCGKAVYSRVARVCKNDEGGSHKFRNRWTTFLKTRLNCSVPGDYPFYFDQIQSTTNFFPEGGAAAAVFYAVFTTPPNSIHGSAVCRFSLADLDRSFEGNFKNQERVNSNWLAMSPSQVPQPRPGRCYNQTTKLPEASLHFIKNHCLMDESVESRPAAPVFIKFGDSEILTKIAAQRGVTDINGNKFDVLFIGTNRGKVIKTAVRADRPGHESSAVQEEMQIFPAGVPVLNLLLVESDGQQPRLIVLSADEVRSVAVDNCREQPDCRACMTMGSLVCSWSLDSETCIRHSQATNRSALLRSPAHCPLPTQPTPETTTIVHDIYEEDTTTEEVEADDATEAGPSETTLQTANTFPLSSTAFPRAVTVGVACPVCATCRCPAFPAAPPTTSLPAQSYHNTSGAGLEAGQGAGPETGQQETEALVQLETRHSVPLTSQHEGSPTRTEPAAPLVSLSKAATIAAVTGLASLVLGFLAGFFLSRVCCTHKSSASVTSSNVSLVKPCPIEKPNNVDSGYTTPTNCDNNNSHKNVSPGGGQAGPGPGKLERTKLSCTGTLQKVKRVYL